MNQQEIDSLLLHTEVLAVFNEKYFEKVLNAEHINTEGMVNFPKAKATDGEELDINFFGWIATKNGVSWLIPNTDKEGNIIKIKDILPLVPTKHMEIGFQNKSYRLIKKYNVVKYKKENILGMKGLVNKLSANNHTNPQQRKLLIMSIISQIFYRAYFRFSSPPGFGKDSIIDTLNLLVGGCATIENPSVPKLEREASIRNLTGLNEVVGLTRNQWVDIGKFMLAACAYKPSITKRTRAFGGVGETINLRNYSISLFYNDIDCYPDKKVVYFDDLAEQGVKDRLPAMRLHGGFTYDFNKVNTINVEVFVDNHWEDLLSIIYTLSFFKNNLKGKVVYSYDLSKYPARWQRSLGVLLMVIQEYVDSQEEFDEWVALLKDSMLDYVAMIEYPNLLGALKKTLSKKEFGEYSKNLIKEYSTFSGRVKDINNKLVGEPEEKTKSKDVRGYW